MKVSKARIGSILLIQAATFLCVFFILWGSQSFYGLMDPVTFQQAHAVAPEMAEAAETEKGKALLDSLTNQLRREMNSPFGWSGNDILFNKYCFDNRAYRQYGVYMATKTLFDHYSMVIAKLGSNDRENDFLYKARMNCFSINPQKFWFPSAESSYNNGLELLEDYKKGLDSGESIFNARTDDIYSAFNIILGEGVMGYALGLLQDSQNLSFHALDNRIYEAQGVALVVRDYVTALYALFPEATGKNNADNMEKAIYYLDRIATYDPLYITSSFNSGELVISYLLFARNRLEDIRDSIMI